MKLPKQIYGHNKIRDAAICRQWLVYLDSDDDLRTVMAFKTSLVEQNKLSYRYINKILRVNWLALKPDKQAEKNKRFWKLKLLAKGKLKSNKDITDILEQQKKEIEGDRPLVKIETHSHFTVEKKGETIENIRKAFAQGLFDK